jgi:hypothetical protein
MRRGPVRVYSELLVEENGNLSQRQSGVPWRWPVFPVGGEPGAQASKDRTQLFRKSVNKILFPTGNENKEAGVIDCSDPDSAETPSGNRGGDLRIGGHQNRESAQAQEPLCCPQVVTTWRVAPGKGAFWGGEHRVHRCLPRPASQSTMACSVELAGRAIGTFSRIGLTGCARGSGNQTAVRRTEKSDRWPAGWDSTPADRRTGVKRAIGRRWYPV